jgi:hypothetical protein
MHLVAAFLTLYLVAKLLRGSRAQEELVTEQRLTNKHLKRIREQAAWASIRSRFLAEHGMTIEGYGRRYGLPFDWLKAWSEEMDAATQ